MKKTPFIEFHRRAGARLIDFGGWEMPVQFSGIMTEHRAVRQQAGLFDISHMGQVWVSGPDARAFLQRMTTNNVGVLKPGKGQYSLFCREDGGVVDDLYVYMVDEDRYFLIVNASRREVDMAWLTGHAQGEVEILERSGAAGVALQGPASDKVLSEYFPKAVGLNRNEFGMFSYDGSEIVISRTGYTGEPGFELFGDERPMTALYPRLQAAGAILCGLGARDTLRLEMGYRLYGNDLDEDHSPLACGLGWVVKWDKGDFIGREALAKEKERGPAQKTIGLMLLDKGVPRHGYAVLFNGRRVGEVTSGTFSPSLEVGVGLARVDASLVTKETGGVLTVDVHGRPIVARLCTLPFLKESSITQ